MNKETILVVGATGTVGSEVVRILKSKGYSVRSATSRQAQSPDQVHLNVVTREGLVSAFEGVDKAFLLAPPGFADQFAVLSPMIEEAKKRNLKKVVLMTSFGANAVETTPFRRAEVKLEKSGLAYNIVRPNWFQQNFHTRWIQGIQQHGQILLPAGQAKTSFIDTRDISEFVAALLMTDQFDNRAFDITGSEALDHTEVANIISEVTGRRIGYQEITPLEFRSALLSASVPTDYADFLVMILGLLKEGYFSRVTPHIKEVLGREPRAFYKYAQEHKHHWT